MLDLAVRVVAITIAVLLLLDMALPASTATRAVSGLNENVSETRNVEHVQTSTRTSTSHTVFFDGRPTSCSVSSSTHQRLRSGDEVQVRYTRLLAHCLGIDKGGETMEGDTSWRWIWGFGALFLLVLASSQASVAEFLMGLFTRDRDCDRHHHHCHDSRW